MSYTSDQNIYNLEIFKKESEKFLDGIKLYREINSVRDTLLQRSSKFFRSSFNVQDPPAHEIIRMRDCSLALMNILSERSEKKTGFSVVEALWDIAKGRLREDLEPGFFAELINWIKGIEGRADFQFLYHPAERKALSGRERALERSDELDSLWEGVERKLDSYSNGLSENSKLLRTKRKIKILDYFGATEDDWNSWKWHIKNILKDSTALRQLASIGDDQSELIERALKGRLPFGVTPYYVSLLDEASSKNDAALRSLVFPNEDYVDWMTCGNNEKQSLDFMLESETSPKDLITRRYPGVAILKPVSTCPQICVYCQRNWEIDQVMEPNSFASLAEIDAAIEWINDHPAVREVLVTGGDPFILSDNRLKLLFERLSEIKHIDLIRIGTRTLVTLPQRITDHLAELLGSFREVGKRDVAVMTHVEHPYEITMETAQAVDRLRRQGIGVYNQQVYTFYVSRRFESAYLRIILRRIGIDPYYTFAPKGKEETNAFRIPLARILQEQKEEARLIPGLRRTDEAVFNVPGLGKNYLRAAQHRDLLTVLPDGGRVYEFHPWEMAWGGQTYIYKDVPILTYLNRLADIGENPNDYDSIWFFL